MIHGKDIIIYEGSDEPVAIAASKSCTIDKQAGTVETSSPASGTARSYASGRTDWVCTMNNLVLSVKDYMLRVGETYFITMGVRGSSTDTITGYAICTECNITGTVGNLAQGSFRFQGSDRDGTLPPQPGETGYDMTVDQVTAIVYSVVGDGYLSRLHNDNAQGLITFNAGAYIPTGQSLRIGDAYLTYDAQNKMIKVWDGTGNEVRGFYATGSVSALGAANGSGGGGGGGGDLDRAGLFNILTGVPQDASEWISAKFLKLGNGLTAANDGTLSISGAVTSVGLTMPTGFTVSGSPITSSGVLAVSLASGYKLLTSSTATPGTYTKVTVDTYGRVTGGTSLSKTDIPSLDYIPITGSDSISGKLEPLTDASYDIGASGYRWRNGYFSGTVHATTFDGNAASASKLNTSSSYSVFGQTYWNNGVPQTIANNAIGQMKYLSFRNNANTGNAGYVGAGSTANNDIALIAYSGNNLLLGANGKTQATFDGSRLLLSSTTTDTPLRLKGNGNSTWTGYYNSSDTLLGYLGIDDANGGLKYSNGTSYWTVLHTGNCDSYVKALNNYYSSRPTSANIQLGNGKLVYFMATGSMTTGKPASDAQIIHLAWDNNGGWDSQLAVRNSGNGVQFRGQTNGTWGSWHSLIDERGGTMTGNLTFNANSLGVVCNNGTYSMTFMIGSGGSNRGIWDSVANQWTVMINSSHHTILGWNSNNSVNPSRYVGIGTDSPSQKLHVSGNILATGGVTALSDMRQKTFLAGVNETTETIAALPIFYFKWKAKDRDEYMHIGTSAQAVQKIFPELVLGKDELSVDYGVLGVTISILNSRVLVTHEQRIKALESRIETLEGRL